MKSFLCKLLITLTLVVTIFSQCSKKTLSGWGEDGNILVLSDSLIWKSIEPALRETFEKRIITPQTETIFTIKRGNLENFKRFKNLIFLATLNDTNIVSKLVKSNLSDDAKKKVEENSTYIFIQKEKWASEQLIFFLIAKDTTTLKQKISENKQYLFSLIDDYWNEINHKRMYRKNEQISMEKKLLSEYGWTFKIPYDYDIFIHKPDSNFIMLRRMLPERWLFVHWIETDDPSIINAKWCIKKRDELGKKFYDSDKIEQKFVQPDTAVVDFLGKYAIKLSGVWRNDIKSAGGPFRNYCFYDENDRRIYMLDYAIFQPRLKDNKRGYLRQAEIMLHTFKTSNEISTDDL